MTEDTKSRSVSSSNAGRRPCTPATWTGVLADHSDDIVMFDVPPPHDGVRGIDAYRGDVAAVLPVAGARRGVRDRVELDVTAGEDVAFAHALLRCDTPDGWPTTRTRLRLTIGLRKEGGRWVVAHEHHSFCDTTSSE